MNVNYIKAKYHIAVMKLVNKMAHHKIISEETCNKMFRKHGLAGCNNIRAIK